ncbi:maleylpyruvate isomerase family mycothiol-dependent enzyme [Nocardioides sp.]|uniref:maleylpyruvate isomerase family mycothiol-dependent enzyme n=1 Tax=Nocardioides sp. TaxID=35761 RepID=UPI003D0C3C4D
MTTDLELLHEATQRLVRRVDGLPDAAWAAPSGLPEWTRAHVIAHLTLNAEGLAGALAGLARGESVPMYATQEARDSDIAGLAAERPAAVRQRCLASTSIFVQSVAGVPDDAWHQLVERVPGGRTFPASGAITMRLREVEIHHADLDVGYTPDDWSSDFAVHVIEAMALRETSESPFRVEATDLARQWSFGDAADESAPTVNGSAARLAWWLTGRGTGQGLSSNDGVLPRIETW